MNAFGEALNLVFMRRSEILVLVLCQWTQSQTAFPWVRVPIPLPMNLRLHSHESLFLSQWISGCLSSSPYSLPMNLWMHSHESLSPCQILESFGWVPSMSCHPDSGMPLGFHQLRPERDFGCTPYNHTWVPLKSIVEHFRCLLRDFCFWLGFMRISDSSIHDVQYLCRFYKNPVFDLLLGWSPSGWGSGWDSWFRNAHRIP